MSEATSAEQKIRASCAQCNRAHEALLFSDGPERMVMGDSGVVFTARQRRYLCSPECKKAWDAQAPLFGPEKEDHEEEFDRAFHKRFYEAARRGGTWLQTKWMGVPVLKSPFDLWVLQEIIHEVRPQLIIETGTYRGGSALFMASVLDAVFKDVPISASTFAMVCSIDVNDVPDVRPHPRIYYYQRSSVDPQTVRMIRHEALGGGPILVVLDSDHTKDHVLAELKHYAPLVTPGSYLVVEDTNVNGHPVMPNHGPGPFEAVQEFLASPEGKLFEIDRSREKYLFSFNTWLRKKVSS